MLYPHHIFMRRINYRLVSGKMYSSFPPPHSTRHRSWPASVTGPAVALATLRAVRPLVDFHRRRYPPDPLLKYTGFVFLSGVFLSFLAKPSVLLFSHCSSLCFCVPFFCLHQIVQYHFSDFVLNSNDEKTRLAIFLFFPPSPSSMMEYTVSRSIPQTYWLPHLHCMK